jgi:hypothetical protein
MTIGSIGLALHDPTNLTWILSGLLVPIGLTGPLGMPPPPCSSTVSRRGEPAPPAACSTPAAKSSEHSPSPSSVDSSPPHRIPARPPSQPPDHCSDGHHHSRNRGSATRSPAGEITRWASSGTGAKHAPSQSCAAGLRHDAVHLASGPHPAQSLRPRPNKCSTSRPGGRSAPPWHGRRPARRSATSSTTPPRLGIHRVTSQVAGGHFCQPPR